MKVTVKQLEKSQIEIEGEIPVDIFEGYFQKALNKLGSDFEIDGFRKGKAPESVLLSKIPESTILGEMASLALAEKYPNILEEEEIDAIGRPEITITKLARKNPLGFKIKTAVLPQLKLPDYKKLAKEVLSGISEKDKDLSVTDEDIESTIMDIRKSRAPKKHITEQAKEDGEKENDSSPEKTVEELPEFNDDFVKALGPFEGVEDFKTKLRDNLKLEKQNSLREKTRIKIMEKIMTETEGEIPDILVDSEVNKIIYRVESDISQMGLVFEDYLKHINKTKEDLQKEFRADGEKKAKLSLIFNEIAKKEKIVPGEKEVEREVTLILEHYKEADPESVRIHAENVLTNEKIFQLLESQ